MKFIVAKYNISTVKGNEVFRMKRYRKRIADDILIRKLEGKGAVLIEGPKWCGKATTAEQLAASILYMDDPEKKEQNIAMSELNPKRLLKGATPRLIDEWQLAPKLWDAIRFEVDHRGELGQFVLTGSAVPADTREITHSGTGRFTWLTMRPMSLYESGDSTGEVRLKDLFSGAAEIDGASNLSIDRLAFLVCRGGWPQAVDMQDEIALDQAMDYYDAVVHSDINRADNVQKNPERVKRLMRSYARNQGGQVPNTVLAQDIAANDETPISEETVASYVSALRKIFVVEDMPAWNPNLRSKTAIRSSDTRYYIDPSIAAAALGIGPNDLINDLKTFGFLFETLCIRDLRVFADALNGEVYHYRDKDGLECDAVVHLRNGNYGLIEIKLGGDRLIEEGAKSLKSMEAKIDTDKMNTPSFLMVLTGTGDYAYRRQDGVYVVPIGCLRN
ncbi:ATP-binding protein [Ruthenibacterium lactatiformans]|uniref:ATP-binding protein n=1 Tax=Ruthenibacterium lactatiformans TaxID=1550024 RepID=UPI003464EBD8